MQLEQRAAPKRRARRECRELSTRFAAVGAVAHHRLRSRRRESGRRRLGVAERGVARSSSKAASAYASRPRAAARRLLSARRRLKRSASPMSSSTAAADEATAVGESASPPSASRTPSKMLFDDLAVGEVTLPSSSARIAGCRTQAGSPPLVSRVRTPGDRRASEMSLLPSQKVRGELARTITAVRCARPAGRARSLDAPARRADVGVDEEEAAQPVVVVVLRFYHAE